MAKGAQDEERSEAEVDAAQQLHTSQGHRKLMTRQPAEHRESTQRESGQTGERAQESTHKLISYDIAEKSKCVCVCV